MMNKLGGRKFIISSGALLLIGVLAGLGADAAAYGAVAVIVGAYNGANGYIEGRYATPPRGGES